MNARKRYVACLNSIAEAKDILANESDAEMKEMDTLPLWQKRLPRNRGFWLSLTPQILGKITQRTLLSAHPKKRIQPQ